MAFQNSVSTKMGFGVVGEFAFDGPRRVKSFVLNSADAANNVFARAFTSDLEGVAQAGGVSNPFVGLMVSPKEHVANGTNAGGTLAPTLQLPNGIVAQMCNMGEVIIAVTKAASRGDKVVFNTTTGVLDTLQQTTTFTGVIATNTLTVSGFPAGGAPLGVGTQLSGANITPGTMITALGTGTGGNGTYTVNQATAASAPVNSDAAVAPTGFRIIPRAVIWNDTPIAAGLAVVKLLD